MEKYDPEWMEMAERNVLYRAIFNEIRQGRGTKNDGILVDLSRLPKKENRRWSKEGLYPQVINRLREVFDEKEIN